MSKDYVFAAGVGELLQQAFERFGEQLKSALKEEYRATALESIGVPRKKSSFGLYLDNFDLVELSQDPTPQQEQELRDAGFTITGRTAKRKVAPGPDLRAGKELDPALQKERAYERLVVLTSPDYNIRFWMSVEDSSYDTYLVAVESVRKALREAQLAQQSISYRPEEYQILLAERLSIVSSCNAVEVTYNNLSPLLIYPRWP